MTDYQPRECEVCACEEFVSLSIYFPRWKPDVGLEYDADMAVEQHYTRISGPKWRTRDRTPCWIVGAAIMGLAVWLVGTFVLGLWP